MRLWSVHPRYFDRQALTACWREAPLAHAVILGRTREYTAHPLFTVVPGPVADWERIRD